MNEQLTFLTADQIGWTLNLFLLGQKSNAYVLQEEKHVQNCHYGGDQTSLYSHWQDINEMKDKEHQ
jgi:hypothetical protein